MNNIQKVLNEAKALLGEAKVKKPRGLSAWVLGHGKDSEGSTKNKAMVVSTGKEYPVLRPVGHWGPIDKKLTDYINQIYHMRDGLAEMGQILNDVVRDSDDPSYDEKNTGEQAIKAMDRASELIAGAVLNMRAIRGWITIYRTK